MTGDATSFGVLTNEPLVASGIYDSNSPHCKETGAYYTPPFIANYIAGNTLRAWLHKETGIEISSKILESNLSKSQKEIALEHLKDIKILDPAVGNGVFLIAAAQWLLNARYWLGDLAPERELRKEIVLECIHGVDISDKAVSDCKYNLHRWATTFDEDSIPTQLLDLSSQIKQGNSLIGSVTRKYPFNNNLNHDMIKRIKPFHWENEFQDVMDRPREGFDVIIGNPPYGNILSSTERKIIASTYVENVNGGRKGTWNSAALFIVRSRMLLRSGGHLGFLVPNSIVRVGQFTKTRRFLLRKMKLWEMVDEGSPFDGVTLEMVSIFCRAEDDNGEHDVRVISRRKDCKNINNVPWRVLNNSRLFSLYYDNFYDRIVDKGSKGIITAGRGRDIPALHVSDEKSSVFRIPYATSGRSVKRYKLDYDHIVYVDDWFKQDAVLNDSYERSFLIATKNYPHPRCFMKPKGIIHGGGAVQIRSLSKHIRPEALGLILNSTLVKYICIRYLTNYSRLTTCLNTGIMEELPIVYPEDPEPFVNLFNSLQLVYGQGDGTDLNQKIGYLESVADSMVYALYLCESSPLLSLVKQATEMLEAKSGPNELFSALYIPVIKKEVNLIASDPIVERVRSAPRMK